MPPNATSTALSVIVCTRSRPGSLRSALMSLLADTSPDIELLVVDQSDDARTQAAVEELAPGLSFVRYHRSVTRGLSAARNEGAQLAGGDVLLFTDDDCLIEGGWASAWQAALKADPQIGVAFGRVRGASYDPARGHISTFEPEPGLHVFGSELFWRGVMTGGKTQIGMGANMAVRRPMLMRLGGFDQQLGAGAPFGGAEEIDLAYRGLALGYRLAHASEPCVWHYGFRARADASRLVCAYYAGTGAMLSKHIRCGDLFAARLLLRELLLLMVQVLSRVLRRRRPLGLRGLVSYVAAVAIAGRRPLDRRRRLYQLPESAFGTS